MNKRITLLVGTVVALGITTAGIVTADAARVCKASLRSNTSASMPTRALARASAVTKWSAKVTSRYNLSWSNWDNALAKNYNCWRKTTVIGTNALRPTRGDLQRSDENSPHC